MDTKMTTKQLSLSLLLAFAFSASPQLAAQVPVDEYGEPLAAIEDNESQGMRIAGAGIEAIITLTAVELEELIGPVALYPDDLLAIVLPASTYPLEIVQAARFLDAFEVDGSLEPDESWDESIIALLNYPEVLRMMDEEIDWTWRLGEAVIGQQEELIAAVEAFRDRAYAAGNLESDEYQRITNDDGIIVISPVDEEIIYVPYYQPEEVVVYQPRPVYHYYPSAYPVYYYPYPYGHRFSSGHFWGVTTAFGIGWSNNYLHVYHPSYWGHPYYAHYSSGHYYSGHYYRQPSISVYNNWYVHGSHHSSDDQHRDGDTWRPQDRNGARPATRTVRNRHYPPGHEERNRFDSRSGRRTPLDTQASTRQRGNNSSRSASDVSDTPGIQFRNRAGANSVRAGRGNDSGRGNRSNSSATTGSSRQSLFAQNTRDQTSTAPANSGSRASRRSVATARQAVASTPARSTSSRRQVSQRPASRPTVQTQTSTRRITSRPTVQRRAPTPRSTPVATPQRQSAPRQTAPRQSAPRQSAPRQSAPRQSAPRQSAPRQSAPRQSAPRQSAPRQSAPRQTAPRQTAATGRQAQPAARPQRKQTSARANSRQRHHQ